MADRVRMEDVARESGVSLATVSLVLRGKPGINEETRQRVLEMARTLGYQRRSAPEPAPFSNIKAIGLIVKTRVDDPPEANPFYSPVVAAVEAECRRRHINLLLGAVEVDVHNHPRELPRMLSEGDLDGLLVVGTFVDQTLGDTVCRRLMPVVLVDSYADRARYDSVVSHNFDGAYAAVAYLIRQGHCDIALVGTEPNAFPSIRQRREGYIQALADHGLPHTYFADSLLWGDTVETATTDLLRQHPAVTALFCANDSVAMGAMRAAQALGRSIPGDLSVMGFDNISLAGYLQPPLTTMEVDKASMGRLAVELLARRAVSPHAAHVTTMLYPTLVERASVAAPL